MTTTKKTTRKKRPSATKGREAEVENALDAGVPRTGAVVKEEPCGCIVEGSGTIPEPWRVKYCPTHATWPDGLEEAKDEGRKEGYRTAMDDLFGLLASATSDRAAQSVRWITMTQRGQGRSLALLHEVYVRCQATDAPGTIFVVAYTHPQRMDLVRHFELLSGGHRQREKEIVCNGTRVIFVTWAEDDRAEVMKGYSNTERYVDHYVIERELCRLVRVHP